MPTDSGFSCRQLRLPQRRHLSALPLFCQEPLLSTESRRIAGFYKGGSLAAPAKVRLVAPRFDVFAAIRTDVTARRTVIHRDSLMATTVADFQIYDAIVHLSLLSLALFERFVLFAGIIANSLK